MIRTYEAGVGVMIMLVALLQFVMLSAGRLGEQWDSTELDVEVKKALETFQTPGVSQSLEKYSKIRDPDFLEVPQRESVGYRILVNGEPVDKTVPPTSVEVAASDARIYHQSRDAPRLVGSFHSRLLRSDYVQRAGSTMDHESVDELADIVMALLWDAESRDILQDRVRTLLSNQNDDGGWGFVRGEESDTLSTSMAIQAISAWIKTNGGTPLSNSTITSGISWLKDGVHADGGYGGRERLESTVEMTASAILAYAEAGLDAGDQWVAEARDYLLRLQGADGGFPVNRRGTSQASPTAIATEALMAIGASQSTVGSALDFLETRMVNDGDFGLEFTPVGGSGTYEVRVYPGYIVDCSPRGHEFWGDRLDDSIVGIVDVYGTRENFTVVLRIERGRLVPPDNKQKIALCFSKNMTPDDTDWWILNAGNPHTAGQGKPIDDPKFSQEVHGEYTYLTLTDLVVPDEYDFFNETEDWLIAIVGDESHPVKDNPGWGYLVGYWAPWMKAFDINGVLAWRAWSPRVNRVCIDVDKDGEWDDKRLTEADSIWVRGMEWVLSIQQNATGVNITFRQAELNYTRWYWPQKYDLSTIPDSASTLYHMGVISVLNKPSFSKDYKVVLRDSKEEGVYDEAYIWNGTQWNFFPEGSIWNESGIAWRVEVEDDFLVLTDTNPTTYTGLSGSNTLNLTIEGDFLEVEVDRNGPEEVWMNLYDGSVQTKRAIFASGLSDSTRQLFGTWGGLRETSKVYHCLSLAEWWASDLSYATLAHNMADLGQQAIKFGKIYNSVIEDLLGIEAWYKSEGGG
jgi:hypothetical protein